MLAFLRSGGVSSLILVALGLALLAIAALFARTASPQRLALIRALTFATAACAVTGFVSGLVATATYVARHALDAPLAPLLLGFAESATNLLLGGGAIALAWLLVAVGVRRMPAAD